MSPTLHRLRGHKITPVRENISYTDYSCGLGVEAGYIRNLKRCSCGTTWQHVCTNPLRNEWKWR